MGNFGEYILSNQRLPAHIPANYSVFQLCKYFSNSVYRDDFLDGKFYMSTIQSLDGQSGKNLCEDQMDELDGTGVLLQTTEDSFLKFDVLPRCINI